VHDARRVPIHSDWLVNRGQLHIQVALLLFRLAARARASRSISTRLTAHFLSGIYRGYSLSVTSIDVPTRTSIGPRLIIRHGFGLVIHADAVIGADVTLRQGVTVGARSGSRAAPKIGAGTDVGSGAQIIGDIVIGDRVRIGAGTVVVRDVPEGRTVVGNPGRVLERVT
jgi:putative colanic acid biosynthesis acetyltransferase WcaB